MGWATGRSRWVAAALAVATVVGGVVAPGPAAVAGTTTAPATASAGAPYVALGDSFTAGPLIPNQTFDVPGCLRSDHNYPRLAARSLGVALDDASCSGARTDHMTAPQDVELGPNPPQLDALGPATRLVTVGIGGNDIGFSEIIENCLSPSPFGTPCQDRYVVGGVDVIAERVRATAPKIAAVLRAVAVRAPAAAVYVVGYPAVVPDSGWGCWPVLPIAWRDVPYLRSKTRQLNSMLATQATLAGAVYVDTYTPSIGHDACTPIGVKWVEPPVPTEPAAPVHPNARGMAGMAAVVTSRITTTGGR